MSEIPPSVVVVGAGQAGASTVQTLRTEGYDAPVTLIGDEPDLPYQRPPLSKKYLLGAMTAERLLLKPAPYYSDQTITVLTGARVAEIDRAARHVVLEDGGRLPYGALVLATGAVPNRLPAAIGGALDGVHLVRTRADVDRMAPDIAPGRRVLIVGGGYIGLEAAAVCAQRGMRVSLVEREARILSRVACAETAAAVRALHREHGVEVREGTGLVRLHGEAGRVGRAELTDGSVLDVDLVIVGIGVRPDTRLAEAAGLAVSDGIEVDRHCRTSDPLILAAGDCARFPYEASEVRLESVQNAIDMGTHAARVLMGSDAPYRPVPWFWSDQYDARLQIAGLGRDHDRIIERPGHRPGGRSFWYFRGERLLAVDALSDPKAYMQGKRWIEQGVSPDPALLDDASVALTALALSPA